MLKKIIIITVVLLLVAMAFMPMWTSHLAEQAFANPTLPASQDALKKAVQLKMHMFMFSQARPIAEKAIIIFPESKNLDFYIYSAAICGDKEGKPDVAIYWYDRFVKLFPKHEWTEQARNHLNKLEALHGPMDGKKKETKTTEKKDQKKKPKTKKTTPPPSFHESQKI
jgi:tetratricopeptide (TPR) repeat protein